MNKYKNLQIKVNIHFVLIVALPMLCLLVAKLRHWGCEEAAGMAALLFFFLAIKNIKFVTTMAALAIASAVAAAALGMIRTENLSLNIFFFLLCYLILMVMLDGGGNENDR